MNKLETYQKEKQIMKERMTDLKQTITTNEEKLSQMEKDYKGHVMKGEDKKADTLFPKIEALKNELKSQRHKQQTLSALARDSVKELAVEAVKEVTEIKEEYENNSRVVREEVEKRKQEYINACKKAIAFNNEFENTKDLYVDVYEMESLQRQEIGNNVWSLLTNHTNIISPKFDIEGVY